MKKNKIILLATSAFILLLLGTALVVLRKDIQVLVADADKELKFFPVEVNAFSSLAVPKGWKVKIRQGRDCKIELAAVGNVSLKPAIDITDGTATLKVDTAYSNPVPDVVYARITMPSIGFIQAGEYSQVRMENFTSDSISLVLANGTEFLGRNNSFKYVNYKTVGEVNILINNLVGQ